MFATAGASVMNFSSMIVLNDARARAALDVLLDQIVDAGQAACLHRGAELCDALDALALGQLNGRELLGVPVRLW
jgi:hypothetical protein